MHSNLHKGPACRAAISKDKVFSRQAFEPSDKELADGSEAEDSEDMPELSDIFEDAVKGKAKKRTIRRVVDSEDDSEGELDSEMEDFIVHSDEDEEEKDARRAQRKRKGKKRAVMTIDSDYESDSGREDDNVIYGKKARVSLPKEQVKMLPRFLPSTKMKVRHSSSTSLDSLLTDIY